MLFHLKHLVFQRLDHWKVTVDNEVDDPVQDVIRPMVQQFWRVLELLAQFL
ncbi:hypothetical protein D3C72_2449880 [compost metagenome]